MVWRYLPVILLVATLVIDPARSQYMGCTDAFRGPVATDDGYIKYCRQSVCGAGMTPAKDDPQTNKGKGLGDTVSDILDIATDVPGLGGFADVGLGVMNLLFGKKKSSGQPMWNANQMQNGLSKTQDYIVCKMSELTGETIYQIDKMFTDQMLKDFNNAITSINSAIAGECGSMRCLSQLDLPPSQRNGTCKVLQKNMRYRETCVAAAAKNSTWDPEAFETCQTDTISQAGIGICDPTDGQCYRVYFWDQAEIVVQKLLDQFLTNAGINSFQNFNDYQDPVATLALATGSLVKVILLQQKVMLGMEGSGEDLRTFLTQIADQLEARYNDATSIERAKGIINLISFGNSTHLTANPCGPSDKLFSSYNVPNSRYPESYHVNSPMRCYSSSTTAWLGPLDLNGGFKELYIESNATIRKSCTHQPQQESLQCKAPEFFANGQASSYPPPGVGTDDKSIRDWLYGNGYFISIFGEGPPKTPQWLYDSCDVQFTFDCLQKVHALLNPGKACFESIIQRQRALVDAAALELSNELKDTLQPVKMTVDAYRKMAEFEAGMHPEYINGFKTKGYPSDACISPAPISGANSLLDETMGGEALLVVPGSDAVQSFGFAYVVVLLIYAVIHYHDVPL